MKFDVSITTFDQLKPVLRYNINKLYIPFDLFYWGLIEEDRITKIHNNSETKVYISLPRIIRDRDDMYLRALTDFLLLGRADGVLVRNLESIGFLNSISNRLNEQYISINGNIEGYTELMIDTDSNLYTWNKNSLVFNYEFASSVCAPLELTIHELADLKDYDLIIPVYGRNVLMVSANCVKKTTGNCAADCTHGSFEWKLSDRMKKQHLVYCNCIHCYNEIYNAYVTSYHKKFHELTKMGFYEFKFDFTDESPNVICDIMDYYINNNMSNEFPVKDYTQGHIIKGTL